MQKSFPAPVERNPNINVSNNNNALNTNSNFAPKVLNEQKNVIIMYLYLFVTSKLEKLINLFNK